MRVTQSSIATSSLANLQQALQRIQRTQEQMSTGRVINRASDNPTGTVSAMSLRADIAATQQQVRNAQDGLGWLGVTDTAIQTSATTLGRARALVVSGLNATQQGQQAREALATEIDQLREALLTEANTSYLGRPVFGGTTGAGVAYAPDGSWAAGEFHPVQRRIGAGDGGLVQVGANGHDVFGADGAVFTLLADISAELRAGTLTGSRLTQLDDARDRMLSAAADVGARYARLSAYQQTADMRLIDLTSALSDVQNVDLARVVVELQSNEVAYQAALGATGRVLQPSLLDFLR